MTLNGMRGADGFCDDCVDDAGPDLPAERFGTLPSGLKSGFPDRATLVIRGRDLDGLPVDETVATYADLSFDVGGQTWKLWWGPYTIRDLPTYAPGSEPVTVYRADNDTWVVTTTGLSTAFLYLDNKQTGMLEHHGQFLVPFAFTAVATTPEDAPWGDEPWEIDPGVPALRMTGQPGSEARTVASPSASAGGGCDFKCWEVQFLRSKFAD